MSFTSPTPGRHVRMPDGDACRQGDPRGRRSFAAGIGTRRRCLGAVPSAMFAMLVMFAPTPADAGAGERTDALYLHPRLTAAHMQPLSRLADRPTPNARPLPCAQVAFRQSVCGSNALPGAVAVRLATHDERSAGVIGRSGVLAPLTPARGGQRLVIPVSDGRVTSEFGLRRHPLRRVAHRHTGVDLAAPTGTPVRAAADGVVKTLGFERRGYGRYIVIEHRHGSETIYAHLSVKARSLSVGDRVVAGDVIGAVGKSGAATGAHLHFELRQRGLPVDPGELLRRAVHNADGGNAHAAGSPDPHGCRSVVHVMSAWHPYRIRLAGANAMRVRRQIVGE
ncbi:M23 family metallopeptidase [Pandoraea morbifera]|nr:M23 family metallopeptidase [Pandoraea morbifera]